MKIKLAAYIRSGGDGSASALLFRDTEAAEAYAAKDDERMCDDIETLTFEVDENGILVKDHAELEAERDSLWSEYCTIKDKKGKTKPEKARMIDLLNKWRALHQ